MATINPHTTRATGTVLTGTIYNTDHENHVSNAGALNAELAATTAKFPGVTVDNTVPRFNGITGSLQTSSLSIDDENQLWVRNGATGGFVDFDELSAVGALFTAGTMNTTSKYTPGVLFGSTDANFTTENPKILAAIVGRAYETYAANTDSGMGIDFFVTDADAGAAPTRFIAMSITEAGNVAISGAISADAFNITSDERLKKFLSELSSEDAIEIIRSDPVRHFEFMETGEKAVGWGAQTSYSLSKDLASPGHGNPGEEDFKPWGMDYSKRTPYLWAALTAALDKIDELTARVEAKG